jgi:hypothetical protein
MDSIIGCQELPFQNLSSRKCIFKYTPVFIVKNCTKPAFTPLHVSAAYFSQFQGASLATLAAYHMSWT